MTINKDKQFQAASTIKVSVVMAIYEKVVKGELDINSSIQYINELDADDFGTYDWYIGSDPTPLKTLLYDVIVNSDNVAANMLIRTLGGNGHHQFIEKISNTQTVYDSNIITPYQSFCTLNWLYVNPDNNPYYKFLIDDLHNTPLHNRISKYLPLPLVAEKTGDFEGYANAIAIVYTENPYILILYVDNVYDAYELMAQTSLMIYNAHEGFTGQPDPNP
jgi:beta-lactamase class A